LATGLRAAGLAADEAFLAGLVWVLAGVLAICNPLSVSLEAERPRVIAYLPRCGKHLRTFRPGRWPV
jgi:hypothetical protein